MTVEAVKVITNPKELPSERMRMESCSSIETAQAWAKKIERPVWYLPSGHVAYAPISKAVTQ